MSEPTFRFEPVPAPKEARVDHIAETYGLPPGLRAEAVNRPFRCGECHAMSDRVMVWVPDWTRPSASRAEVSEMARQMGFNGHWTGWCLPCCQSAWGKKPEPPAAPVAAVIDTAERKAKTPTGFWARLKFVLFG